MDTLLQTVDTTSREPTIASLWSEVSGRDLDDRDLQWPADVFALVGTVLTRTHAYRFVVSPPPGRQWPPRGVGWSDAVTAAAEQWSAWAEAPDGPAPALVAETWARLRGRATVGLDEVASGRAWPVCEALLTLAALSDEACAAVAGALPPFRRTGHRHRARAAELLARTGSLARIPTHRMRVLPKVHTPPGGISVRSLSRYLCLRGPAVEVGWHKAPARRPGAMREPANVLLLPWPLRVRQRDFRPLPETVQRVDDDPFGLFAFEPDEPFDLDLVERVLLSALDEVAGVDAVVFPESAVPAGDIDELEALLASHGVPLLVAGTREATATPGRLPANWVHIGVRLGDSWSHHRQDKHHRWSLDGRQIAQYDLAGALHPSVRWWEAMEVPIRSLQFVELAVGVVLVAVVCEDLARLDEVAELLRDVGPTLVVTILLDGPQLPSRWTARYASVLADDPGSAVLTLSAHGMVARSRPAGAPASSVVGLWKDPARGFQEIPLEPGAQGVLVSLAATRTRRRCADGRTPVDDVTGLSFAGAHPVRAVPGGPAGPEAPRTRTRRALDPVETTVLTSWADTVADILEQAPQEAVEVVADALPGAPWRRRLGTPEPSSALGSALTAVADAVAAAGDAPRRDAVLLALGPTSSDGDAPAAAGGAALRWALQARDAVVFPQR